jgi:hypothetical protein
MHTKNVSHLQLSHRHIHAKGNIEEFLKDNNTLVFAADSVFEPHLEISGFCEAFGFRKKNVLSQPISSVINLFNLSLVVLYVS